MLTEKQAELTRRRSGFERQCRNAEAQLNALHMPEDEMETVNAFYRMATEGIDHINFASNKTTLKLFDVRITVLRSACI